MNPFYVASSDHVALQEALKKMAAPDLGLSFLFLMAEKNAFVADDFIPQIQEHQLQVVGGIFPGLIVDGVHKDEGALIIPLPFDLKIQRVNLDQAAEDLLQDIANEQKNSLAPNSTLFTFFDALSPQKSAFTEALFNYFGINASYIGGGAGSLSFNPQSCVIDSDGIHQNAAVFAWTNNKISIGSAHGWETISDPLKITRAENNQVFELDWEPAFDTYRKVIEQHSGQRIDADNFFDIAKSYPFGISKMDAEMVVRDPFKIENNGIQFFDQIQTGEYIQILHGNMDSLLKGAKNAKDLASKNKINDKGCFCIDCISRAMFMGDSFQGEMDVLQCSCKLNGALTIGEVANKGESYLEIFNKTIVLGLW